MTDVLTKAMSHRLWQSGAYGNKLRSWLTVGEYLQSDHEGLVTLRASRGGGGQFCLYDLSREDVAVSIDQLIAEGVRSDAIMVNESAPNDNSILQAEYFNGPYLGEDGYPTCGHLLYSRHRSAMRTALRAAPEHAHGLRADIILANAMSPGSLDDWKALLAEYPDHVLEVSVYDMFVGDVPWRNALVWEVRKY